MMIDDQVDYELIFLYDEIDVYVVCSKYSQTFDNEDGIKFHDVYVSCMIKCSNLWLINKEK